MFIFKREPSLPEEEITKLKKFIGKTVEAMLLTKEETLNASEEYDLVLICSCTLDYIEASIYQLSNFRLSKTGLSSLINTPLYTELHYFEKNIGLAEYVDDKTIKSLSRSRLGIFCSMCELLGTFEIEVESSKKYKCIWK